VGPKPKSKPVLSSSSVTPLTFASASPDPMVLSSAPVLNQPSSCDVSSPVFPNQKNKKKKN